MLVELLPIGKPIGIFILLTSRQTEITNCVRQNASVLPCVRVLRFCPFCFKFWLRRVVGLLPTTLSESNFHFKDRINLMPKLDNKSGSVVENVNSANFKKADGFINLRAVKSDGTALKGNTVGIPVHKPTNMNKNDTATVLYRLAEAGRLDVLETMFQGFAITVNMVDDTTEENEAIDLDSFA